jgi:hypothetical protein
MLTFISLLIICTVSDIFGPFLSLPEVGLGLQPNYHHKQVKLFPLLDVNFINILDARFWYESSFSLVKFWQKRHFRMKKCARKMLMQLTPDVSSVCYFTSKKISTARSFSGDVCPPSLVPPSRPCSPAPASRASSTASSRTSRPAGEKSSTCASWPWVKVVNQK